MREWLLVFVLGCLTWGVQAQEQTYVTKKLATKDSIVLDSVSISSLNFKVQKLNLDTIPVSAYHADFMKAILLPSKQLQQENDSLVVSYTRFPSFLTKTYKNLDEHIILPANASEENLYSLQQSNVKKEFVPFDGLNTSGSISRGIRVGNNQNAVVNSELDLQISGNLSDDVTLRASIKDANVPTQEGGYSQRLNEFDQVFIELEGKNWGIRAGDIDLMETKSFFASYTKKVQGLLVSTQFGNENYQAEAYVSGALVRGVFTRSELVGQEGNQGPYKLRGPNGELFVLIISGSEAVFVNGVRLKRGEAEDYIIDYNAGEIIFNSTFPISSEMRIVVEYQYADQNFSRIIATAGGSYATKKLQISSFVFNESDLKNQPLRQNLTDEQVQVLQEAGDDQEQMLAPSAVESEFSENRVLYRKETFNGTEIFVFSTDPEDELFSVRFSNVGANQGNYVVSSTENISRVFEYVPPINGVPQGDFEPVTQLFAPTLLQIGVVQAAYQNGDFSQINGELAVSNNDLNTFSKIDNEDNQGTAAKIQTKQRLTKEEAKWNLDYLGNIDYIGKNYTSIERLYNVEFQRDWNIFEPAGNQLYVDTGFQLQNAEKGQVQYQFQHLDFSESFTGNRQVLSAAVQLDKLRLNGAGSYLKSEGRVLDSEFSRSHIFGIYDFGKYWAGAKFAHEDNQENQVETNEFTINTQAFKSYEVFTGVGDSTKVFVEVGYRYRENDSLRSNQLKRVNNSNNFYVNSTLVNSASSKLSIFASYRNLNNLDENVEDENTLNSRVVYNQFLFDRKLNFTTSYETNSGSIAQQEFTYLEVNPGDGQYVWIDYNENGVQELDEFEIAQFPGEADYVRVLLPNQVFIRTNQNRFSQQITANFRSWAGKEGIKKLISKFFNQTSYLIDRKVARDGNLLNLNPFSANGADELGLNVNFRNTLFFNRGKQRYTTSYTYISSQARNLLSIGLQDNNTESHQLNFIHKMKDTWLITLKNQLNTSESFSENFENRNFLLEGFSINPKLSYLLSGNTRFDAFVEYAIQENQLQGQEQLNQRKLGTSFTFNKGQEYSINGEFNFIQNEFEGSTFTPVAYQMMEGLQPDNNFTWSLFVQKKITKFLDLNLSYFGRKSEGTRAIHTGNVQLRAYF
ncbi:hypothetical protein [Psychroflexus planctonicus]|uniref:Outer membrane protein beta-barrel family protein n=1 Tax=Psychroflexus planctonicus TaxID=1526575 RepID=A0ABQ1SHM4_9FLAO|nr:hypothetical protein [Psychroflexus planctonicus]GGE35231.1 hypothetical protein GCM10010832_14230 [Psychroflexus planctonicus]